jgi:hypothetical protein
LGQREFPGEIRNSGQRLGAIEMLSLQPQPEIA